MNNIRVLNYTVADFQSADEFERYGRGGEIENGSDGGYTTDDD